MRISKVQVKLLVIFILTIFMLNLTLPSLSYSHTWSSSVKTDQLQVDINPIPDNFEPEKVYTFTIMFTPKEFAVNQYNFRDIYLKLRLTTYQGVFENQNSNPILLNTLGNSYGTSIAISIPSASSLGISGTQSIQGSLEYYLTYNLSFYDNSIIGVITDWISITSISIGSPNNINANSFALVMTIFLAISLFVVEKKYHLTRTIKERWQNYFEPENNPQSQSTSTPQSQSTPTPQSQSTQTPQTQINTQNANIYSNGVPRVSGSFYSTVKFCKGCGSKFYDDDKFCFDCGRRRGY